MNPNPSKFLVNEIAFELLGNKIYDLDGNCVNDINTLCNGNTNKSNSKQGSSSQHANEKSLQEILGITDEMLEAPTDAEESEVISLTDDDDEKTNEGESSSRTNVTAAKPSAPLSVEDSEFISVTDDDMEKTNTDEGRSGTTSPATQPSFSFSVPPYIRIVPQYSNAFQSLLKNVMLQARLSVEDSEVISLTDDDDEKTDGGEASSSTTLTATEPSAPLSVEDSEFINVTDVDMEETNGGEGSSSTTSTATQPSFSFSVPPYTRIEPQYSDGFQPERRFGRVKKIRQYSEEEFKSMKNDSK